MFPCQVFIFIEVFCPAGWIPPPYLSWTLLSPEQEIFQWTAVREISFRFLLGLWDRKCRKISPMAHSQEKKKKDLTGGLTFLYLI